MALVRIRQVVLLLAAFAMALVAGFFYAYACSVMLGLARLDAPGFVVAMQAINETVRNPVFFFSFFGALGFTALAALASLPRRRHPATWLIGAALLVYALGGFGVTAAFNVPLNTTLAELRVGDPATNVEAARLVYEAAWVRWNLVRTVASTVAFLILCIAVLLVGRETDTNAPRPTRDATGGTPRPRAADGSAYAAAR